MREFLVEAVKRVGAFAVVALILSSFMWLS